MKFKIVKKEAYHHLPKPKIEGIPLRISEERTGPRTLKIVLEEIQIEGINFDTVPISPVLIKR